MTTPGSTTQAPAVPLLRAVPRRLDTYEQCPRQYRLHYVDRPGPAAGAPQTATLLGVATHAALSAALDGTDPATPERAVEHLARVWPDADANYWRTSAQSGDWYRRFQNWLWRYVDTHFTPDPPRTFGVERTVAAPSLTLGIAVEGRVDRIDNRDGEPVIVDYKTGREAPTEQTARSSRTLAMYAYGAWKTFRQPTLRVELHHIPTGTVAAATHTTDTLRRHLTRAADVTYDIQAAAGKLRDGADPDATFPTNPGPLCSYCLFRRHCPDGQAAADDVPPWASLDRWEPDLP